MQLGRFKTLFDFFPGWSSKKRLVAREELRPSPGLLTCTFDRIRRRAVIIPGIILPFLIRLFLRAMILYGDMRIKPMCKLASPLGHTGLRGVERITLRIPEE